MGNGTDGVAGLAGDGGRLGTDPAHVAEHHGPGAPPHLEDVVEVTAHDVGHAGGAVARPQVDAGHVGHDRWQERLLQHLGHPVALTLGVGPVHGAG